MDKRHGDWIETFTGRRFWPLDPRADEVDLRDIAHALSLTCRYGGHCRQFYSVAQHSLWCEEEATRLGLPQRTRLLCLLHDAAEAYMGDMPRPLKDQFSVFAACESAVQHMVWRALGVLPPDVNESGLVRIIDNMALNTESRVLMPRHDWPDNGDGVGLTPLPLEMSPQEAERRYVERVECLLQCLKDEERKT